jgi:hypothetical protein
MKSVKFLTTIIIVLLLALAMAITNPGKDDFITWAVEEFKENSNSELEALLGGVLGRPVLTVATTREDYFIFSIFTVEQTDEAAIFLGVFKQFIKLKG